MNTIISLDLITPKDVATQIAARVKARRLELNLTQEGLALRAGIKLPTYRKFEQSGTISLKGLLQIGFALNLLQDFDQLFAHRQYETIEDVLAEHKPTRKRGHRK